jgi:phospholipase C
MSINRRDFLRGAAGLSGMAAFTNLDLRGRRDDDDDEDERRLPPPEQSGIDHVVVVMMENRSFDHLLGWLPEADGRQRGLRYADAAGMFHRTHALASDFTGCGHLDPNHEYNGGRVAYDHGAIDGFLRATPDDYAIGYYVEADRPFFNTFARHYTVLNRSFCSILGPTFPNRFFLHGAQTDRLSNTTDLATMPTIWDRLAAAGVSHTYYYSNLPYLALWGLKYLPISNIYAQFLLDAATGSLPAVSFIDPRFTIVDDGTGNDDHPHADIRSGDAFLAQTFHAVANGPDWASTVFIVTYDEWGGFFDHVRPPRAAAPNTVDPDLVNGKALLGFRIPTIVASPWSSGHPHEPRINSRVTDHTSILKLIEWRWGLPALTARDASRDVQNLAHALDFDNPRLHVPPLPQPTAPPPTPCIALPAETASGIASVASGPDPVSVNAITGATGESESENEWLALFNSGLLAGWLIDGL